MKMIETEETVDRMTAAINVTEEDSEFFVNITIVSCDAPELLSTDPLLHLSLFIILVTYLLPTNLFWAKLTFHWGMVTGHLVMTVVTWAIACTTDMVFWHLAYILINIIQVISVLYMARENKFEAELEAVYETLFVPFKVSRSEFSYLLNSNVTKMASLHPGECYAVSGLTRADHLGLLLAGRASVLNEAAFLHNIEPGQFLDSPEFESSSSSNDSTVFQVTICAAVPSKYISWQKCDLEYLFVKQPKLGTVMSALISRDVSGKVMNMAGRMERRTGVVLDIRLPPFMSRMMVLNGEVAQSYKSAILSARAYEQPETESKNVVTLTRDKSRRIVNRNNLEPGSNKIQVNSVMRSPSTETEGDYLEHYQELQVL